MVWAVLAVGFPIIIAAIMIFVGIMMMISRTRGGIQTTGTIIGKAGYTKKMSKVKMDVDAPIVKYTVGGNEYTCTVSKFRMEGINFFDKGDKIRLRVDKKNPYKVKAVDNGGILEKLLIAGGIFIIIAFAVLYIRNWDMLMSSFS